MATITGTSGNNLLRGTQASDTVWGLDGSDTFRWNPLDGADTFHGGASGYDTNVYGDKADGDRLFIDGDANTIVRFTNTADGTVTSGGQAMTFTGVERLHLGDGNDIVRGGAAGLAQHPLSIWAGGGNDVINGSRFGDFIDGGSGNDRIYAGAGDDFVQSSTGNDLIYGGAGQDNIRWGQGNGGEVVGNDTIYGNAGNDLINVWIKDGDINDRNEAVGIRGVEVQVHHIRADAAMRITAETTIGGPLSTLRADGFELLWTHAGNDTVDASGATTETGIGINANTRWGHDRLTGSAGNDTLEGGDGRDTITGGAGDDLIYLGEGRGRDGDADTVVFRAGHGRDVVYGFEVGRDVLDLGGRDYDVTQTGQGMLYQMGEDSILLAG